MLTTPTEEQLKTEPWYWRFDGRTRVVWNDREGRTHTRIATPETIKQAMMDEGSGGTIIASRANGDFDEHRVLTWAQALRWKKMLEEHGPGRKPMNRLRIFDKDGNKILESGEYRVEDNISTYTPSWPDGKWVRRPVPKNHKHSIYLVISTEGIVPPVVDVSSYFRATYVHEDQLFFGVGTFTRLESVSAVNPDMYDHHIQFTVGTAQSLPIPPLPDASGNYQPDKKEKKGKP